MFFEDEYPNGATNQDLNIIYAVIFTNLFFLLFY